MNARIRMRNRARYLGRKGSVLWVNWKGNDTTVLFDLGTLIVPYYVTIL